MRDLKYRVEHKHEMCRKLDGCSQTSEHGEGGGAVGGFGFKTAALVCPKHSSIVREVSSISGGGIAQLCLKDEHALEVGVEVVHCSAWCCSRSSIVKDSGWMRVGWSNELYR